MDDTVAACDVCRDDFGVVNHHALSVRDDLDIRSLNGFSR